MHNVSVENTRKARTASRQSLHGNAPPPPRAHYTHVRRRRVLRSLREIRRDGGGDGGGDGGNAVSPCNYNGSVHPPNFYYYYYYCIICVYVYRCMRTLYIFFSPCSRKKLLIFSVPVFFFFLLFFFCFFSLRAVIMSIPRLRTRKYRANRARVLKVYTL